MVDKDKAIEKQKYPTSFGLFYPIGYVVVAFSNKEDALRVQQDLIAGGYERDDCAFFSSKEVKMAAQENLDQNQGFFARYGWADEAIQIHLDSAQEGSSFLVIYAPDKLSSDRAMNVVRRVPFEFAHGYHRLAIEILK